MVPRSQQVFPNWWIKVASQLSTTTTNYEYAEKKIKIKTQSIILKLMDSCCWAAAALTIRWRIKVWRCSPLFRAGKNIHHHDLTHSTPVHHHLSTLEKKKRKEKIITGKLKGGTWREMKTTGQIQTGTTAQCRYSTPPFGRWCQVESRACTIRTEKI